MVETVAIMGEKEVVRVCGRGSRRESKVESLARQVGLDALQVFSF